MVDIENQWEDIEYSEDNEEQKYASDGSETEEDYGGDDYDYGDYEDDDEEQSASSRKKGSSPVLLLLLLAVILGVAGFAVMNKMRSASDTAPVDENTSQVEQIADNQEGNTDDFADGFFDENGNNSQDMMSVDFNENGDTNVTTGNNSGDDVVATVNDSGESAKSLNPSGDLFDGQNSQNSEQTQSAGKENNSIVISYDNIKRLNPFKPPVVEPVQVSNNKLPTELINNTPFEIIEPPVTSIPDENLSKLLQTQISGILYDDVSPSAIVNINGTDQFVKVGDNVGGYTIKRITKNQVEISYKNNNYVASVGELFSKGSTDLKPDVVNLENKFAGRKKNKN